MLWKTVVVGKEILEKMEMQTWHLMKFDGPFRGGTPFLLLVGA